VAAGAGLSRRRGSAGSLGIYVFIEVFVYPLAWPPTSRGRDAARCCVPRPGALSLDRPLCAAFVGELNSLSRTCSFGEEPHASSPLPRSSSGRATPTPLSHRTVRVTRTTPLSRTAGRGAVCEGERHGTNVFNPVDTGSDVNWGPSKDPLTASNSRRAPRPPFARSPPRWIVFRRSTARACATQGGWPNLIESPASARMLGAS